MITEENTGGDDDMPLTAEPEAPAADPEPSAAAPREYFYSSTDNAFYLSDELSLYQAAGTFPSDLTPVDALTFQEYALASPPAGKTRAADEAGLPCWIDEPPLPDAVVSARNTEKRDAFLRLAAERIAPLQDAVDLDIATDEERQSLSAWKAYRVALNRLAEQPGYPLDVDWPPLPS